MPLAAAGVPDGQQVDIPVLFHYRLTRGMTVLEELSIAMKLRCSINKAVLVRKSVGTTSSCDEESKRKGGQLRNFQYPGKMSLEDGGETVPQTETGGLGE